jgi:hypothetical protein
MCGARSRCSATNVHNGLNLQSLRLFGAKPCARAAPNPNRTSRPYDLADARTARPFERQSQIVERIEQVFIAEHLDVRRRSALSRG